MRINHILMILLFFIGASQSTLGQGIEFEHGTWAEAQEKAQKEDKMLFVDGYAVWCGPCKRLAKDVFPQKEAGDFFNAHFINVKMDMEKGDGLKFRKDYPISAFPTLYFIAPDGELIQASKGAPRNASTLVDLAQQAMKKYDRSAKYLEKYEGGDRSWENTHNLVKALNKAGEPSLMYANEYLRDQKDLTTKENLMMIFESMTQVDSRIYKLFKQHLGDIQNLYSETEIEDKIIAAAYKTADQAAEFKTKMLLDEANNVVKNMYPDKLDEFEATTHLKFALATKEESLFKKYMGADIPNENAKLFIKESLDVFPESEDIHKQAEKWADEIASEHPLAANYFLLALCQVKQERTKQAIKSLKKCIELTDDNAPEIKVYMEYLQKLEEA